MSTPDPSPRHQGSQHDGAEGGHPSLLEAEALEFTRALIRIESVNTGDPRTIGDGETRAARFVQQQLGEIGISGELIEPTPGRASFVARIAGEDPAAPALLAHAHLDVVPVEGQHWRYPPFGAEIHDGLLYGRGAVDMKNYAGTLLAVLRHYARNRLRPRRDLVVAFLADEEHGGAHGAGWLVRHRPELFAGVTESIGEVGGYSVPLDDDGRRAYLLATGEKGAAGVRLRARGTAGHGSRLTDDNAVVALAGAVARIGAHRFDYALSPTSARLIDVLRDARGLAFSSETLSTDLASLGFFGPLVAASMRSSINPTVLDAGGKTNIVPELAEAKLDVRILPGEDRLVRETLAELAGPDVEVLPGPWWSATESPIDSPLVGTLQRAIGDEDPGATVAPYLLPASTDNKHFSRLGISGYGFVPLRVPRDFDVFGQFHAADECVPVTALYFCARVTEVVLRTA